MPDKSISTEVETSPPPITPEVYTPLEGNGIILAEPVDETTAGAGLAVRGEHEDCDREEQRAHNISNQGWTPGSTIPGTALLLALFACTAIASVIHQSLFVFLVNVHRKASRSIRNAGERGGIPQNMACEDESFPSRDLLIDIVNDFPPGFPQLAAFMSSAETFQIVRQFSRLRTRRLVHYQSQLIKLDSELTDLDNKDHHLRPQSPQSETTEEGPAEVSSRKALMNSIDHTLDKYDDILHRIATLTRFKPPSARNFASFKAWVKAHWPTPPPGASFLEPIDDFITLGDDPECGWLDEAVEDGLDRCIPRGIMQASLGFRRFFNLSDTSTSWAFTHAIQKLFSPLQHTSASKKEENDKNEEVSLRFSDRLDALVRILTIAVVVALLMAPSAVLYLVPRHKVLKIFVILIFTTLFSCAVAIGTKAKRHELAVATAR